MLPIHSTAAARVKWAWAGLSRSAESDWDPLDCSPPGSCPWDAISQARILEWVFIFSSRGSSRPRDRTHICCLAGGFFTRLSHQGSPNEHKKHVILRLLGLITIWKIEGELQTYLHITNKLLFMIKSIIKRITHHIATMKGSRCESFQPCYLPHGNVFPFTISPF